MVRGSFKRIGQGRENAKNFLIENPEIMVEISERVWRTVKPEPELAEVISLDEPISLDD